MGIFDTHKRPTVERRDGARATTWRVRGMYEGYRLNRSFPSEKIANQFADTVVHIGAREAVKRVDEDVDPVPEDTVTVEQWVTQHIDSLTGVTEGTRRDYRSYLRKDIAPAFGKLPLPFLTRRAVAQWVNGLEAAGLSGKTIKNRHAFLSSALSAAADPNRDGGPLVPFNVAHGLRLPRADAKTREPVFLTPMEYQAIYEATPAIAQPLVALLAGTGMRIGEATALQVRDVDLQAPDPVVRVVRAWKHTDGGEPLLGPPKSRKGRRSITLPLTTARLCAELMEGRAPEDWLATTARGTAWTANYFRERYWHPAVKASGITKRPTPHDLRHSHASWLIQVGRPLAEIQLRLGHEDITTTVGTYGHLQPDMHRQSAHAIEDMVGQPQHALPA